MTSNWDLEGKVVREEDVASDLGFESLEAFQQWLAEDCPTGRCSNERCWRPAFWPHLKEPCQYCGSKIRLDVPGEENP